MVVKCTVSFVAIVVVVVGNIENSCVEVEAGVRIGRPSTYREMCTIFYFWCAFHKKLLEQLQHTTAIQRVRRHCKDYVRYDNSA